MNRFVGVVVALNLGIALGGLYLARQLWRWRQIWATLADTLTLWECDLHATLAQHAGLTLSHQQLRRLRQQYLILQRWLGYLPYLRWALQSVGGVRWRRGFLRPRGWGPRRGHD